jgi:hypothetical protein
MSDGLWDEPQEPTVPNHAHTEPTCAFCAVYEKGVTQPRTLARSGDPSTSHAAARSADVTGLEALVLADVEAAGEHGVTQDELLALHPTMSYSSVTARPAALRAKGLVRYSGRVRAGASGRSQRVLVAAKWLHDGGGGG